jgi:hypothetical protein
MAGAGVLPLVTAPVVANMRLHHVFYRWRGQPQCHQPCSIQAVVDPEVPAGALPPFSGVGPQPVYPLGSITFPVTFGTEGNFCTENVQFDVAEVNLPFNAIIGWPALYRFMAIAHYGYLVLKMSSPAGILTVRGDCTAVLAAIEKLHTLAAEIARPDDGGRGPMASNARTPSKAPKVQPSGIDGGPAKTIQVSTDPSQTTRIAGNLGEK